MKEENWEIGKQGKIRIRQGRIRGRQTKKVLLCNKGIYRKRNQRIREVRQEV